MKILVTNDDGINSPGLWAAVEALRPEGEVHVVAPDREQSGVGASLTLHAPVRAISIPPQVSGDTSGVCAFSVEGTPGDSCVLALERLVGKVDLVVSGINQGSNLGTDVLVSGTVGAALHGYLRGCPAIALSVAAVRNTRYDVAAWFLAALVRRLWQRELARLFLLNVNVPNEPTEAIKGVEVSRLSGRSYTESVTEGNDGRHGYYWIKRDRATHQEETEDTDVWAVRHKKISVTPLNFSLTQAEYLPALKDALENLCPQLPIQGE